MTNAIHINLRTVAQIATGLCTVLVVSVISSLSLSIQLANSTDAQSDSPTILTSSELPQFSKEHAVELLEETPVLASQNISNRDVARFVFKKTRELLPVPFRGQAKRIARELIETSNRNHMDPVFLMAVISQESRFNPEALGTHGEIGLMQIKPSTACWVLGFKKGDQNEEARLARLLHDPASNVRIGAEYIAKLRSGFHNHGQLYISAYNMGAAKLRAKIKNGEHPHEYSTLVLAHYVDLSDEMTSDLELEKRTPFFSADIRNFETASTYGL